MVWLINSMLYVGKTCPNESGGKETYSRWKGCVYYARVCCTCFLSCRTHARAVSRGGGLHKTHVWYVLNSSKRNARWIQKAGIALPLWPRRYWKKMESDENIKRILYFWPMAMSGTFSNLWLLKPRRLPDNIFRRFDEDCTHSESSGGGGGPF